MKNRVSSRVRELRESRGTEIAASDRGSRGLGGSVSYDEQGHGGVLQQEAGNAAEGKLRPPAAPVSREDQQIDVIHRDVTQNFAANITVDRHQGVYMQAAACHALAYVFQIEPGGAHVAIDEALLEIVLPLLEWTGARAFGMRDDVEEDQV